jgi:phage-related protein
VAVVGDAYVMIHAITSGIDKDIKDGFKNVDKHGDAAGDKTGRSFKKGFNRGGGGSGMFKNFLKESEAASKKFSSLTRTGYTLAPLIQAAAGTIGVLGTSLVSLGSIIGAITLPAITVLGASMMSLAQAAITVKLAFAGVAKAISAGNKAAKKGADNAKAIEKANKALIKAQRALAKAYEDAAKAEIRAKRDLIDAENELHKAREQAIEDLQQLGFDSEDAAIAEQRAAIELEKARETLARVSDLPPNSRARKEAELAFAEADLNYRRAIDKNNDLKKTEAKNAAMGDFKAQVDGQENVVSAIRAVNDATENLTETKLENARAILSATENRDDAAEAVKDVKENKAATDAYADALADLSPEAQKFVKYIVSLKDEFKKLKAAAGKDLFPLLEKAIDNLVKNLFPKLAPLLQGTGKVLGEIAVKFSKTVTSAENLKRLENIWKTNDRLLSKFGDALNNVYEAFLILLEAAKPLIDAFGDWIVKVTGAWKETLKADEATGKLADRFKIAKGIFKDLGTIFGNVFGGLGKLFEANTGPGSGGQIFLDYFKKITENFKNLKTIDGKPIKEFFADAAVNGTKLLDLLGKIFGGFIRFADDPALGIFYDNIGKAVDILNTIDLGGAMVAISEFGIEIAKFIKLLTDSGSIEIFFGVLTTALEKFNKFLASDLGQNILRVSAKVLPFLAALGLIAKVGGFAFKVIVGGISRFVKFFTNIPNLIRGVITLLADMAAKVGLALGPFMLIVVAITAVIAILIGAYTQSEKFRESIAELGKFIKEKLLDNFEKIKTALGDAFGGGGGMDSFKEALKNIGDFIAKYVMPYIKLLAGFIIDVLGGAITALIYIVGALKDAFTVVFNVLKGLFRVFTGDFSGAAEAFKDAFGGLISFFENIFKAIFALVEPFVSILVDYLSGVWDGFKSGLEAVWNVIKGVWGIIVAGVKGFISVIKTVLGAVWNGLKTGLDTVWSAIKTVWSNIISFIGGIKGKISGAAAGMWDGLKNGLSNVINTIISGINFIIRAINKIKIPSIGIGPLKTPAIGFNLSEIAPVRLAKGGVVRPSSNGTFAQLAEAGKSERVEPLDAQGLSVRDRAIIAELSGGKGTTINMVVNPSAGMDERELAAIVSRQIAFQTRRGAA